MKQDSYIYLQGTYPKNPYALFHFSGLGKHSMLILQKMGKGLFDFFKISEVVLQDIVNCPTIYIKIIMRQNISETDHPDPAFFYLLGYVPFFL